jgi:phosphate transport system protein
MPREEYQELLDELRTDVRAMGDAVLDQLDRGLTALDEHDADLGQRVVDSDARVNERYLELESDCIDLLALQQPVAGDLRFVVASFKILTDLERVGDLATNFGRYAQTTGSGYGPDSDPWDPEAVDVSGIGKVCHDQLEDALDAYEAGEADACRAVADRDDEVDALCQRASEAVVRDLLAAEASEDAWAAERVMDEVSRLLLTVRDLERVGDHAVNVAARTLYMVEDDPELVY